MTNYELRITNGEGRMNEAGWFRETRRRATRYGLRELRYEREDSRQRKISDAKWERERRLEMEFRRPEYVVKFVCEYLRQSGLDDLGCRNFRSRMTSIFIEITRRFLDDRPDADEIEMVALLDHIPLPRPTGKDEASVTIAARAREVVPTSLKATGGKHRAQNRRVRWWFEEHGVPYPGAYYPGFDSQQPPSVKPGWVGV